MEFVKIFQIIIALLLTIVVLLQNKGGGVSGVFGGGGNNVFMAKRGIDKTLFVSTIVLSVLFFSVSLSLVLFS